MIEANQAHMDETMGKIMTVLKAPERSRHFAEQITNARSQNADVKQAGMARRLADNLRPAIKSTACNQQCTSASAGSEDERSAGLSCNTSPHHGREGCGPNGGPFSEGGGSRTRRRRVPSSRRSVDSSQQSSPQPLSSSQLLSSRRSVGSQLAAVGEVSLQQQDVDLKSSAAGDAPPSSSPGGVRVFPGSLPEAHSSLEPALTPAMLEHDRDALEQPLYL